MCRTYPERSASTTMRRSISTLLVSAAAAVGLVLTAAAPANASTCATVQVDITSSGAVHMAHHIPAGYLKLDVDGPGGHTLQLARPKHGASVGRLIADNTALSTTGKANGIERDFVAVGGSETGTDLWVRLPHGTYYAFDQAATTLTRSKVAVVHVGGSYVVADRPHVAAVITAVGEMSWAKRPKHIPSHGVMAFLNESSDYHFVDLQQIKEGTTLAKVKAALASPNQQGAPDFALGGSYSTGALSPSHTQLSTYKLPKGLYALLCFWPDENGVPHALMGMVRLIRVG
jgi:hypothetical protein